MRPLRLEISGFTSFREHTEIDFTGADYFVLVGATGSGKSTIIDAICFALYGSVPRYDNRNLVAPVITQGQVQAKVQLEFEVGGQTYTAVRVVTRSGRGATTKEARLQLGDEVLAGTADELTAKVSELLGLTFDHFIKCVVLPQGEFSRFLHDKPADRQDMLVKLLGLDLYDKMRQRAAAIASDTKTRAQMLEQRLEEEFGEADADALEEAKAYLKSVETLAKKVSASMPKLESLSQDLDNVTREVAEVRTWTKRLADLRVPASMGEFGDKLEHSNKQAQEARELVERSEKVTAETLGIVSNLPDKTPLALAAKAHARKNSLEEQLVAEKARLGGAGASLDCAKAAVVAAEASLAAAQDAATAAQEEHRALHLAASLEVGEPCPVCLQVVDELPKHPKATAIEKANKAVTKATESLQEARSGLEKATSNHARIAHNVESLSGQISELETDMGSYTDIEQVQALLAQIATAEDALAAARAAEAVARRRLTDCQAAVLQLQESERRERESFQSLRDPLSALGALPPVTMDLVSDWEALTAWAKDRVPELEDRTRKAAVREAEIEAAQKELLDALAAGCVDCEIELGPNDDVRDVVLTAHAEARAEVEAMTKAIADSKKLQTQLKEVARENELASSLAKHLSASGFERWIVEEAVRRLVDAATGILKELSDGQYSLTVDGTGAFLVTDHHNANETRSAKTLSGGETFLASLSLALALSDQLMDLAAQGSARLDAIFLDEGFGTLDPDTLDTVAATVENLAAGGRMVGIVTHVRDLADRVPTQFRVTKGPQTSTVEKVMA